MDTLEIIRFASLEINKLMHLRTLGLDYIMIDEAFLCTLKLPELRILIIVAKVSL
jgi:hypothetical protein